jgi:hypothetical protein
VPDARSHDLDPRRAATDRQATAAVADAPRRRHEVGLSGPAGARREERHERHHEDQALGHRGGPPGLRPRRGWRARRLPHGRRRELRRHHQRYDDHPQAPLNPGDPTKSQRPDETLLTGDTAAKVKAAALAKYPGATVQRVETDSDGVYEAHLVTKAGDPVTVEMDKSFTVTGTEAHGGPGGPPPAAGSAAPGA